MAPGGGRWQGRCADSNLADSLDNRCRRSVSLSVSATARQRGDPHHPQPEAVIFDLDGVLAVPAYRRAIVSPACASVRVTAADIEAVKAQGDASSWVAPAVDPASQGSAELDAVTAAFEPVSRR